MTSLNVRLSIDTIDMEATGNNIRCLISKSGLKIKDISSMLNVAPQACYKWIHGSALPTVDHLIMLKDILELQSIEEILILRE